MHYSHSTRTLLALYSHSTRTLPALYSHSVDAGWDRLSVCVGADVRVCGQSPTVYLSVWVPMCARLGELLLLYDPLRSRRILSPAEGVILVLDYFIFFQHFFDFGAQASYRALDRCIRILSQMEALLKFKKNGFRGGGGQLQNFKKC